MQSHSQHVVRNSTKLTEGNTYYNRQLQLFHAIKLASMPKSDEESRVITTFGVHSKPLLSIFASTKLKKDVEKRSGDHDPCVSTDYRSKS